MVFQVVRVIGSAMAKVAEALVSAFNVNVGPAAAAKDPTGLALVKANLDSLSYLPLLESAVGHLLRLHMVAAARPLVPGLSGAVGFEARHLTVGFK